MFPAKAGMILVAVALFVGSKSVPRESGDDPGRNDSTAISFMCSPRKRG